MDDLIPRERKNSVSDVLREAISKGEDSVPEHPEPLVCKPTHIEPWRIFRIMSEFVEGFELLRRYGLAATFFGTARCTLDSVVYQNTEELAARLAKRGFAVITGGSAGVMQAANRGAYNAGGSSIGLMIRLPDEQTANTYLTDSVLFNHFFVRKVMLTFASEVYIYMPGGFGTLDEFFEVVTLVQTKKIQRVPIILFDRSYWTPLLSFIEDKLARELHTIDEADMSLYMLVDTVDEAYDYIVANVKC